MNVRDERELAEYGMAIDPDNPNRAILVAELRQATPSETWDEARLTSYIVVSLAEADEYEKQATALSRRSTAMIYRAGHALSILAPRLKAERRWCPWQAEHGIARTTAWEAIKLFERAPSEQAIALLTSSEAKQQYGIYQDDDQDDQDDDQEPTGDAAPATLRIGDFNEEESEIEPESEQDQRLARIGHGGMTEIGPTIDAKQELLADLRHTSDALLALIAQFAAEWPDEIESAICPPTEEIGSRGAMLAEERRPLPPIEEDDDPGFHQYRYPLTTLMGMRHEQR
jgi:hypothetical protein